MTSQASSDEQNKRLLQAISYLIEWAKHVVTAAAALMVLAATFLKDLAVNVSAPVSHVMSAALVLFYVAMLLSVLLALRLVRQCANTVLTTQPQIGLGTELKALRSHLGHTQTAFFVGLASFSVVALSVLLSWALGQPTHRRSQAEVSTAASTGLSMAPCTQESARKNEHQVAGSDRAWSA